MTFKDDSLILCGTDYALPDNKHLPQLFESGLATSSGWCCGLWLCCGNGISRTTVHKWRADFGGIDTFLIVQLKKMGDQVCQIKMGLVEALCAITR